jgi:hypothetical protein
MSIQVILDPRILNGSPEREDHDVPPPLEPIPRPIFLTDSDYLEDPSFFEENHPDSFDRYRSKKCPTPPRHLSNNLDRQLEGRMSDAENDNLPALEPAGEAAEVPKKNQKPKEPPVTFREFDVSQLFF